MLTKLLAYPLTLMSYDYMGEDMKVDEINLLHEKAKNRKDGVYSFKGNYWAVKNNRFIAYADCYGNCLQRMGVFNVEIGKVQTYERKQKLTEWLKKQSN